MCIKIGISKKVERPSTIFEFFAPLPYNVLSATNRDIAWRHPLKVAVI